VALAERQGQPQTGEHVDEAELIEPADERGTEPDLGDQPLHPRPGRAVGTAPEQVGGDAVEAVLGEAARARSASARLPCTVALR
jgi:hypothetical protein